MGVIVNEFTKTVHKCVVGTTDPVTECGVTYHLNPGQLQTTTIEQATGDGNAKMCGRCFEDAGGD